LFVDPVSSFFFGEIPSVGFPSISPFVDDMM
jgi:hypothetical protein